jgi:hypothetical protein
MATLRSTLGQVKQQFHEFLCPSMILQVCHEHDYRFRQRVLGLVETIVAFCVQVLHGNVACQALRHGLGSGVTDAGYCQARQRLPWAIYQAVGRRLSEKLGVEVQTERWQQRFTPPPRSIRNDEPCKLPTGNG